MSRLVPFALLLSFSVHAKQLEHYNCIGDGKKKHEVDMLANPEGSANDYTFFLDGEKLEERDGQLSISFSTPGDHAGDLELFLAKPQKGDWVRVDQLFCFLGRSGAR